jgi:hypothetical protein
MKKYFIFTVFIVLITCYSFGQSENDFDIIQNREGGITITGYTGSQKDVVIPERISNVSVTTIGKNAFAGKGLTRVTIPRSVTMIDERAFANNSLNNLTIPNGVRVIWNEAFANNNLTSVTLPNSITDVGGNAFSGNSITSVVWPSGLDFMRVGMFRDNPVTTINFGGVKEVLDRTFEGSDVASVIIGSNVTINAMSGLDRSFINFYNSNNKRAGTYTRNGRVWSVN